MTKKEYCQKIEAQLIKVMDEIDNAVTLLNWKYHENYREAETALEAKEIIENLLNKKFDSSKILDK